MADPKKKTDADKKPGVPVAPIAALFNNILEKREEKLLEELTFEVAQLYDTRADDPATDAAASISDRATPDLVSRHQPVDVLYRQMHTKEPWYKDVRTPDLDHWNSMWLRAWLSGDQFTMRMAATKACEVAGYRATTLEGVLAGTGVPDGTGGDLLPQPFADVVEIARGAAAVVGPLCQNFTTEGATLRVPTAAATTADTIAEGSTGAQIEPAFTSEMMILHKIGVTMRASEEMLEDSAFNLMEIYGRRAGEAIGVAEDVQILTTAGVSPDLTEALAGGAVALSTALQLAYIDLPLLFFSLGKAYQNNLTWLAGTLVMQLLSQMTDGNGQPTLKVPSSPPQVITDATPRALGTILGAPVFHVPAVAGDLILGDLRSYAFLRRPGIVAKISNEVGFNEDLVHFKFRERVDGRILDDVGIKEFQGIATLT